VVATIIHGRFLKAGIAIQNALGWIKVCVIAFMAFAGISVLLFKPTRIVQGMHHWQKPLSWDHLWEGSEWNFGSIASSFFKVSFAYSGYDNLNSVMDEVQNPIRTLKTAAPAAMVTIFFFYLLLNISYFVVVPLDDIKNSGELVAALFFERLLGEGLGTRILPILIALSAAGSVMVTVFSQSRINQEIARQGFLPFSRHLSSSKPFNTPLGGLIVHLIPSLVVILLPPQGAIYSFILELKAYPAQLTSLAISGGLLYLRAQRPDLSRPFTAWTFAVYLPIALNVALLLAPFFPPLEGKEEFTFWYGTYAVVGMGTIVIAVLYWYVWFRLLPRWRGYRIEEESDELSDGTKITRLVKKAGLQSEFDESVGFLEQI
jgi:amino acid transporter